MRAHLIALGVGAGLGLAAGVAAAIEVEPLVDEMVRVFVEKTHIDPVHIDREALLARARERAARSSPEELRSWLAEELESLRWSFAPIDPRTVRSVYGLPLDTSIPRCVVAAVGGKPTHTDPMNFYAYDFAVRGGTPVLAARPGLVARVYDGIQEGGPKEGSGNAVVILHDDGTFAIYIHLSPGIVVKEGQQVRRGDPLGKSGNTGNSSAPHLHFGVQVRTAQRVESIPILFDNGTPAGFELQHLGCYGAPPPANATLEITVADHTVSPQHVVPVARDYAVQLQVRLVRSDGSRLDVTRDPGTRYASLALWSVDVDATGRVLGRPAQGFEPFDLWGEAGQIFVQHRSPSGQFAHRVVYIRRMATKP